MGKLSSVDDKRSIGQLLNAAAGEIAAALETRTREFADNEIAARIEQESLDLTEFLVQRRRGHSHIVTQATQRLEDVFIGLGFQIAEGPKLKQTFIILKHSTCPSRTRRDQSSTRCFSNMVSPIRFSCEHTHHLCKFV